MNDHDDQDPTRRRILDAALDVFAASGTRAATTRRIAELAGVNEVTLFRHFGTKGELLDSALREAAGRLSLRPLVRADEDPRQEIGAWAQAWTRQLEGDRALRVTCIAEHHTRPGAAAYLESIVSGSEEPLVRYLEALRREAAVAEGVELRDAARMLLGALFVEVLARDLAGERPGAPLEDTISRYVSLLLAGIGARPG